MKKIILPFLMLICLIVAISFYFKKTQKNDSAKIPIQPHSQKSLTQKDVSIDKNEKKNSKVESASNDNNLAPSPIIPLEEQDYDRERIKTIKKPEWDQIISEIKASLISKSQIKKLAPGQTHHIPADLLNSGKLLGLVRKIVKERSEFSPEGEDFFFECVNDQQKATPVRALCLTYYVQTKEDRGQKVEMSQFPKDVSKLAKEALSF